MKEFMEGILVVLLIPSIIMLGASILALSSRYIKRNPFSIELENLSKEREEIKKRLDESNVFKIIQLNLNQTTEYYTINKSHARSSFGTSVLAIITGLITILTGIWLYYFKSEPSIEISIITTASGTLIEFIGALYFHIYNKSIKQLNFFYEKLEKMQDTMLAIELCNGIQDVNKKLELQEKIVTALLNRTTQ